MADSLKVFILGAPRSGTSIVYYAMREVLALPGEGEGHVFPIFQHILHQFRIHANEFRGRDGILARELSPAQFWEHTLFYVRNFYSRHYPEGSWVDKTPGADAVLGVQQILEAFPDARIIVTKRTGIEVVQSFRRKFSAEFLDACDAWTKTMSSLAKVRMLRAAIIEVDQYELTNAAEDVSVRIAEYLGRPEKGKELSRFFVDRRTDQSSEHDWRQRLTLETAGWSEQEKSDFIRICGGAMGEFGYPL